MWRSVCGELRTRRRYRDRRSTEVDQASLEIDGHCTIDWARSEKARWGVIWAPRWDGGDQKKQGNRTKGTSKRACWTSWRLVRGKYRCGTAAGHHVAQMGLTPTTVRVASTRDESIQLTVISRGWTGHVARARVLGSVV